MLIQFTPGQKSLKPWKKLLSHTLSPSTNQCSEFSVQIPDFTEYFFVRFVEIINQKFYFIDFTTLCKTEEGDYLPAELGLVEFSLRDGIKKTYHTFIDPGLYQ
jgi:hypothetical protein